MSPRRGPGWLPKLSWFKLRLCGRVRIPGQPVKYLGKAGCWKSKKSKPPPEVIEEYNRAIAAWLSTQTDSASDSISLATGCTVGELAKAYHEYAEKTFRKRGKVTSHVTAIYDDLKTLSTLFGSMPAEQFAPADLRAYRDQMERSGRWNRAYINASLGRIRKMFQWGSAERDLFSTDVWLRLKSVSGLQRHRTKAREPKTDRPVSPEVVEAVLPHLPPMIAAMVQLQQMTGMRPLEICWMRANEITEEPDGLWRYVASDDANKLAHKAIPKVVFFGPKAQNVLLPWLTEARKRAVDAWLWPTRRGHKHMTQGYYSQLIREACDLHRIERWHPRQLRHTAATAIRKIYGREGAQVTLGHEASEMTERYSSSALDDLARRIARESG